ncbi:MAG: nucleotidyl transferase AbiEii/AbiGii toxin family protein [Pirellulales bacterium]
MAEPAAWPDLRQVEQDSSSAEALCDLFQSPALAGKIAFRGGTAIHKLLFDEPLRYSEDLDLVQIEPGPVGDFVDGARAALAWLGEPRRSQAGHSMHLVYAFEPEEDVAAKMKPQGGNQHPRAHAIPQLARLPVPGR